MDRLSKSSLIQSNKPSPKKRPGRLAPPCCVTLHRNLNLGLPALCSSLGFQIFSVPQIHYSSFDTLQGKFCFNLWWFAVVRKVWGLLTWNSLKYHSFSKNRGYMHLLFFFLYLLSYMLPFMWQREPLGYEKSTDVGIRQGWVGTQTCTEYTWDVLCHLTENELGMWWLLSLTDHKLMCGSNKLMYVKYFT